MDNSALDLFLQNLDPSIVGQGGSSLASALQAVVSLRLVPRSDVVELDDPGGVQLCQQGEGVLRGLVDAHVVGRGDDLRDVEQRPPPVQRPPDVRGDILEFEHGLGPRDEQRPIAVADAYVEPRHRDDPAGIQHVVGRHGTEMLRQIWRQARTAFSTHSAGRASS